MESLYYFKKYNQRIGKIVTTLTQVSEETGISVFRLQKMKKQGWDTIGDWILERCKFEKSAKMIRKCNFKHGV